MGSIGKQGGGKGRKTIKTRISASILASVFLVSLIISVVVTLTVSKNIRDNNQQNLMEFTKVSSQRIGAILSNFRTAVLIMASDPIVSDTTLDVKTRLDQLSAAADLLKSSSYGVTDAKGMNLQTQRDVSDMDYFQYARDKGESFISAPFVYEGTDGNATSVVMVSAPIRNNGQFRGIVFITIDGAVLSDYVKDLVYGETGEASIIDSSGTIIASRDYNLVLKSYSAIEEAKKNAVLQPLADLKAKQIAGQTGAEVFSYGGARYLSAYLPVEGSNGWSIDVTLQYRELMRAVYGSVLYTIIIVVLAMIACTVFSLKMASNIVNPIKRCVERIHLVSQGDLSSPVPEIRSQDEIGVLALSTKELVDGLSSVISDVTHVLGDLSEGNLDTATSKEDYPGDLIPIQRASNKIIKSLNSAMLQIGRTSEQVASGSEQVSGGAQALSQGATEQASAVEELAATITEISDQVRTTAENAQQASAKADSVGEEATESNRRMQDMLSAMSNIKDSSNEIGKIIKTIEDIAFQTNILALNAAVEAARAGSAGKGFAVVADEVRNLATKSGEASKNTASLIESSLKAVENGSNIADETARSLAAVVDGVKDVTETIGKISHASNEQAQSIVQVTQGIDQISSVVQTNSATAEQSAAASEELSGQAQTLKGLLGQFRLKGGNLDSQIDVPSDVSDMPPYFDAGKY